MKERNKKLLLSLLVLVLLVSIGKETYALFTNEVSSVVQSYGTGTLKLSYSNTNINLDNAYPMTDTDGMSQNDSTITITNIGTLAYKFNVILDPSSDSTISSDLIRVSMDGESPATLSTDSNIIIRDVILNPGSSRTFTIKLWINSNTSSSDILGKKFSASLTSTGIAVKNMEDSNGTVLIGEYTGPLYDYIKNRADTTTTIDFSKTSEQDNTNGIYTTTNTDSGKPVYYYRGNVDNRVIFANFCWRIVRTTETGGVKLIYDGVPSNGQCNNTGDNSTIGSSSFNSSRDNAKYVGYMYGSSIDDETYTDESTIKKTIDTWYKTNMTSYTSQLEDTVFCNDRSYTTSGSDLHFGAYNRFHTNETLTLKCQNAKDKFTVDASNGNGALTYPVGLITADEMAYAGGKFYIGSSNANSSFYLYTGQTYWSLSPSYFYGSDAHEFDLYSGGTSYSGGTLYTHYVSASRGVRPSVSLKSGATVTGSGTATDPFVVAKPSLYDYIKNNADTTTTIDFSKTSEASSTNGIYMTTNTEGNVPVYYYRGNVDNRVIFANFCWRIVRTTETGGVKLIYDGVPSNGQCNNTGADSTIGEYEFNSSHDSPAYVGYMYNTVYTPRLKNEALFTGTLIFGNDIDYDASTNQYTLKDTYVLTDASNLESEYTTIDSKYHYTCFTSDNTCTRVYYMHYRRNGGLYYFILTNGKNHLDILEEMLNSDDINTKDSTIKTALDTWYQNNMTSYTSELEDTVFCNDRGYDISKSGWNKDYSVINGYLYFNSYSRLSSYKPSLVCSRQIDKFTTNSNNGNGKLTYPIGLITADEAAYAGGRYGAANSSYYLNYNDIQWIFSPFAFYNSVAREFYLDFDGALRDYRVSNSLGARPVVSLKPGIAMTGGGSGTSADPFVIG